MSGTGRRRKPNPEDEGALPAPPRPPAGFPRQTGGSEHEYDDGYASGYGDSYGYGWGQSQAAEQESQPGPVFDPFSSSQHPVVPHDQPMYYNPVGYGLSDPYSPSSYAQQPPAPPAPDAAWPHADRRSDAASAQPYTRQPSHDPYSTAPPPAPAPPDSTGMAGPSVPAARSSAGRPGAGPDADGLFDETDLFDSGSSYSAVPGTSPSSYAPSTPPTPRGAVPAPAAPIDPVVPPPPEGAARPNDGYTAADFAFLEEETGHDVKSWLTFVETRSDSRADRSRRFRRRLIGAGAAAALVVAGIGGYLLFSGGSLGSPAATKSVVLLQVSDATGNAVADALLITDRSATTGEGTGSGSGSGKPTAGKGAGVLIPSQMLINSTGFGQQPFGGDMAQSIPAAGKDTIADVLGVNIDGVWRMDEITFAGLIDEIGGIQLNAAVAVPAATASPTAAPIPVGTQKLTGGQAVAYGMYAPKGENPDAQIERFGQVVAGLLGALPTDPGAITAYLNHLGIVDDPSLPESKLSPILAALAAEQQSGSFMSKALPVRTDGSNEMDVQAAAPIVGNLLGGAVKSQSNGQLSRVLVEDASGHKGIQSQAIRGAAQARLSNSGYTFIDGSTTARRSTSVVEVGSDGAKSAATQIAATLGLQPDSVQVVSGMSSFADVTVLLGADWPKVANVPLPADG